MVLKPVPVGNTTVTPVPYGRTSPPDGSTVVPLPYGKKSPPDGVGGMTVVPLPPPLIVVGTTTVVVTMPLGRVYTLVLHAAQWVGVADGVMMVVIGDPLGRVKV